MTDHIELWTPCPDCRGTGYIGFAYCACHERHDGYRAELVAVADVLKEAL